MRDQWEIKRAMRDKWIVSAGTVVAVASVLLLLAGASQPDPERDVVTVKALAEQLEPIKSRLEELRTQYVTKEEFDKRVEEIEGKIDLKADQSELDALREQVAVNGRALVNLAGEIDDTKKVVDVHRDILDAISQRKGDQYLPNILANMQSVADFNEEMRSVVNGSIQPKCALTITNNMSTAQTITINETRTVTIPAHQRAVFQDLPTGNVSTRLEGQNVVNWAVGPPTYTQSIDIVPQQRSPVYRIPTGL